MTTITMAGVTSVVDSRRESAATNSSASPTVASSWPTRYPDLAIIVWRRAVSGGADLCTSWTLVSS